ncbi:MAG: large conductance mechanosensitive channel protein MscL [Clostridiales bacterium]|nr:large conductance mechanosensitive channel protein MscL [Clostridiales bacterium]MCD8225351.1 large conductance mechanosensitive channel protein MscL [Clostridiales bacterium]
MSSLLKEFKEFAVKGNMIDLAVGVIIGGAFSGLVSSLVSDIVMPVISLVTGKIDFTNMFIALNGQSYATLAAAQEETSTVAYGQFITAIINFIIMAFVVFLLVRTINQIRKSKEEAPAPAPEPHEKVCPFCKSTIDLDAARCPHCTSILSDELVAEAKAALAGTAK